MQVMKASEIRLLLGELHSQPYLTYIVNGMPHTGIPFRLKYYTQSR